MKTQSVSSFLMAFIAVCGVVLMLLAPVSAQEGKGKTAKSAPAGKAQAANCTDCKDKKETAKTGKRDACAFPMTLTLSGLHCSGCEKSLTTALMKVTGVEEVSVSAKEQRAVVWVCPHKNVKPESLTAVVKNSGYKVVKVEKGQPKPTPAKKS